jgi:mannose-6-phosphate isomerase-like protein (cupin superfamily)
MAQLQEEGGPAIHEIDRSPYSTCHLVTLASGESYSAPAAMHEERTLIAVEGHATAKVDQWRQSLGSGQLLRTEPGASLDLTNEKKTPFTALLIVCPPI